MYSEAVYVKPKCLSPNLLIGQNYTNFEEVISYTTCINNLLVPHLQVNTTQHNSYTTAHPLGRFVCIVIYNMCIVGSGKLAKNDDKTKGLEEENCKPSFNL